MKVGGIAENPLLHFARYTLRNELVSWALAHGLYDEWCPKCRGAGFVLARPCACIDVVPGAKKLPWLCETTCETPDGCKHCHSRCRACRGSRLRPQRPPMKNDLGEPGGMDLRVAMQLGIDVDLNHEGLR